MSYSDYKDIKIIAKRSNILLLSVFICFLKKRQILASQRGVFIISYRIGYWKRQTRSLINLQKVAAMVNSVIRNHGSATWNYYFVTLNNDFVPQILFYQCYFVSL